MRRYKLFSWLTVIALLVGALPVSALPLGEFHPGKLHTAQDTSTIVLDGVRDADYVKVATDPSGDLGPCCWTGINWMDLTNLYVAADATTLYVYADAAFDFTQSAGQIGLAIDTDGKPNSGGASDPWGNAITFDYAQIDGAQGVAKFLPDYMIRGNVNNSNSLGGDHGNGWTELRKWQNGNWNTGSGINWGGITGSNLIGTHIAYSNTQGVEFTIPLADIGNPDPANVHLQFFVTQGGGSKGAFDTIPSDNQSSGWDVPTVQHQLVSVPLATDPAGDLASPGPGDWNGAAWTDQTRLHIWADHNSLHLFMPMSAYSTTLSTGQLLMAIDTKAGGGSTDPWGNAITFAYTTTWQNLGHTPIVTTSTILPDYLIRGNIFGPADNGWTEFRKWNGSDWNTGGGADWGGIGNSGQPKQPGSKIAWTSGEGLRITIPLADIGVAAGNTINLEFAGTQGGSGKGVYDTVPSDNQSTGWDTPTTQRVYATYTIPNIPSPAASHDNNVEYDGLAHDSRNSLYRVPFGTVTPGTPVTLRFRTFHNDVTGMTIRLYDTAVGHEDREPMALAASNVDCNDVVLTATGSTCDFWQYTYTPNALGTTYYRFIITDGTATAYYADNAPRYGGLGQATPTEVDNGFRLNADAANFPVIPWMQNGVMYQIFPDRFRNGTPNNDPSPTDPRYAYPAPPNATPQQIQDAANAQIMNMKWTDLPEGYCRGYDSPATPCTQSPQGRDYFGGDLKGVDDKLDYLKSVGVTILYFNPIFASGSNHGYDTRDYMTINPYFGSYGYFKKLLTDANARGIKVVLDGVFNHLSSDSPFFDRYHHYTTIGACEDINSPYRSWFNFHDVTLGAGVCADSQNRPNSATYDGWAGYDSIPVIVKKDPTDPAKPYAPVANYFYTDPRNSVAGYWLNLGASGWRFDVMTDSSFPVAYWQQLRTITKGIKPDETLIAEAWHWYDNLPVTHGDQADTAMGYRFRNAVLGLLGAVDDKGFAEEDNPNLPPSTFAKRMDSIREDYADATYYTLQNLVDSHDTKRILWSLTPGKNNREDKELNAANVAIGKSREAIAALVQMTVPGVPTIYYGDEVSVTGSDDPDDRRTFPWKLNPDGSYVQDPMDTKYYAAAGDHTTLDWYRTLNTIRVNNPVLRQGQLTFLLTDDANKTLAYALRKDNNLAIVVINRNETAPQTINVPTSGYLRDGVNLTDALGNGSVTTANGKFTMTLNPLKAAIFIMAAGQDITGSDPSTGLTATTNNGVVSTVSLSWTGNSDSASYNVYRSPVQGGGYVKIGTTTGATYTDANVNNGTTYYYVVRGVDALGNEGVNSNEANATPAFPIGYAVLQWPKTINQTITANYTTVYGQIYIQGLTDVGGDPSAIIAQVGFGATGSDPATWGWRSMVFNVRSGNNYEYMGGIRADAVGTYNYLVHFSDDGGRTWVYGDQDGFYPGNPGTNLPGIMTITLSSDTTPPTAPVASIDYGAASLTVSWTASTDPDDVVAEYRVYRGTSPNGEGVMAIAIVPGSTMSYVDTSVNAGQTYFYKVKAFDTSLNDSPFSNEVSHSVEPKVIQVTFRVKVPAFTPPTDIVYISGLAAGVSPDPLCGYCGGGTPGTQMTETAPGSHIWQITLGIPDGTPIQYKYTRSTYDYVEEWGSIRGFTNRVATVAAASPTDLTQLFDDTSDTNPDDNHKAVQNWRDALVTGTVPASDASGTAPAAITAYFNWDVKPDGTDFSNAIVVTKGGTAVAGTISHDSTTQSLTFTPASPLTAGTYTVTIDHVVSLTIQNDGIKIRTPYVFSFTVN